MTNEDSHGSTIRRMMARTLEKPAKKRDYVAEYQPIGPREHNTVRFIERFLLVTLVSFALVETVYQVCLWRIR